MKVRLRQPDRRSVRSIYRVPRRARETFQGIIDSMSEGLMVIDQQGSIVLANPALYDILGMGTDQVLGRGWAELFFGRPENDRFNDVVLDVIQNRVCHHNQQVGYHPPEGPPKELIVTTNLILDGVRGVRGILVVFNDITRLTALHAREQELLSRARRLYQEKLEGLDRLAQAVAHEIRNPVMSIGGLARRLLRQQGQEGPETGYLERILASSGRLEEVVSQVHAYADLPAPRPERLDLSPWLEDLATQYGPRAQAQGVEIKLLGGDDPQVAGLVALADPKLLGRLGRALMDNALEAMPRGGRLTLGLGRLTNPDRAMLSFSDSGKGIDPQDLPFLFDPFYTTKADAVGMSLAICRRIAEEHQGELTASSTPGQGSTFLLTLPAAPAPAPAGEEAEAGK